MCKFGPAPLPRSGYELMSLPKEQEKTIREIAQKNIEEGSWEYAKEVALDMEDPYFWAYWMTKSAKTIRKPLFGCEELSAIFNEKKGNVFSLNGGLPAQRPIYMSFAGDLLCTKGIENSKDELYEGIRDELFSADLIFANLESALSPGKAADVSFSDNNGPKVNLTPSQYETLIRCKDRHIDMVQLANNHVLDEGTEGILTTVSRLQKDGIAFCGINLTERESREAVITEKGGIRTGWVAHTLCVNERPIPTEMPYLVNITPFHYEAEPDLSQILEQIAYCKKAGCEVVIAALHWGLEFEAYPHPCQRRWAQHLIDAGADIVIGHHPHVAQFTEVLHPCGEPEKDVPVIYSLGNLTPLFSCPESAMSLTARIAFEKGAKHPVKHVHLIPVALVENLTKKKMVLVKLKELVSAHNGTKKNGTKKNEAEMTEYISQMADYADLILGKAWREKAV
ncbi:CapA family protein [Treponema sp. OMZ 840]|uniref:CapA family protein n=1 Tax=Treponema sp. OMZ 840 TaxID=244313 RepID=UPI003D931542